MKRRCECTAHDDQVLTRDKKVKFEIFITLPDTDLMSIKKGDSINYINTWKLGVSV